jgi:sensor histidine kinase regulating citrate/malate metabolism
MDSLAIFIAVFKIVVFFLVCNIFAMNVTYNWDCYIKKCHTIIDNETLLNEMHEGLFVLSKDKKKIKLSNKQAKNLLQTFLD